MSDVQRSEGQTVRIIWANLTCDPNDPSFAGQKVSIPTPECTAGSRVADHTWHFPLSICHTRSQSRRRFRFDVPVGGGLLTDPGNEDLLLWAKRFALAMMAHPSGGGLLHLSVIWADLRFVFQLLNFIASGPAKQGRRSLGKLTQAEVTKFYNFISAAWTSEFSAYRFQLFVNRIQEFGSKNFTGDRFSTDAFNAFLRLTKALRSKEHWSVAANAEVEGDDSEEISFPPLPDQYCIKMLAIGDFYIDRLADTLIEHAVRMRTFRAEETQGVGAREASEQSPNYASHRYEEFALAYEWPVQALPFEHDYTFPPRCWKQTSLLITVLQTANVQKVALCTGARTNELLLMEPDCLFETPAGSGDADFARSIRFKTSAALSGDKVAWPIPKAAARAVSVQLKLAAAMNVSAVWLSPRSLQSPLADNLSPMVNRFARQHRLDARTGLVTAVCIQRFRPTIARLVILGDSASPRLVKRILGHRWISTTIGYLRMSPFIQIEIGLNRFPREVEDSAPAEPRLVNVVMCGSEMDSPSLSALLSTSASEKRSVRLIAPGIFLASATGDTCNAESAIAAHGSFSIMAREAFAFAIDRMTLSDVRKDPELFGWYAGEASRIASIEGAGTSYEPPTARHRAVSDRYLFGKRET